MSTRRPKGIFSEKPKQFSIRFDSDEMLADLGSLLGASHSTVCRAAVRHMHSALSPEELAAIATIKAMRKKVPA